MEMAWLRDHGVISSYGDYASLPLEVLEDARLLMEAESAAARTEARRRA